MRKKFSGIHLAILSLFELSSIPAYAASSMQPLTDEELSATQAQALINLSYIAPGESVDPTNVNGGIIGFYKLGMEAEVELNVNIKKLQLGCGGVNNLSGPGGCDIDIDNLSLSGNSTTRDGRASSSAKITNPFIEFAIKNPGSASTREIVGFRSSAEKIVGLLTTGTENSTMPNGINTLSGFMRVQSDSSGYIYGKAKTAPGFLDAAQDQITGQVRVTGLGGLLTLSIITTGGGLAIPAMQNIPFIRPGTIVNDRRISVLPLTATLNVPRIQTGFRGVYPATGTVVYSNPVESPIDWTFNTPQQVNTTGGPLDAYITDCDGAIGCPIAAGLGLGPGETLQNVFMQGVIQGIKANVNIQQSLGYIHNLPINGTSGGYLSLQSQDLRWPGSYSGPNPENPSQTVIDVAKRGWWLSMQDPINLGSVDPTQDIDISPLFPQIAQQVSRLIDPRLGDPNAQFISIDINNALNAIGGTQDIDVTINDPINMTNPLSLTLSNLQLNGQAFAPNCYGTLTFC